MADKTIWLRRDLVKAVKDARDIVSDALGKPGKWDDPPELSEMRVKAFDQVLREVLAYEVEEEPSHEPFPS